MNLEEIKRTQKRVGTLDDGFWGTKSIAACQRYLRSLMPVPNPWPKQDQDSLTRFYGKAGDESQLVNMPVPVLLFYENKPAKTIRVHKKCADSLSRAIIAAYKVAPEVIKVYDGCFNNRLMRGGSLPSLHARGAAIDFDADKNGNLVSWPAGAQMPIEVMECFAREGWLSAGAFWGRDAMHMQATQ